MSISFDISDRPGDLKQIQALQQANIPESISGAELRQEGFVTARHDLSLLEAMNKPYPHIVVREEENIIGYTLVMLESFSDSLPVLVPMFERIRQLTYKDTPMESLTWFVMGQVCIKKGYRGQGLFVGLYQEMKRQMSGHFDCVLTQISRRNPRSIRAHEKAGFKTIHEYWDEAAQEDWVIVLWDWL
ncbi:MAG: GNAT family N-acetyltransferase [Bacteroidetes bacterium]|nr:GNAT family N-acetyltransferase [Bacteroidota bacterium]